MKKSFGFTLAEVLVTLGIIGVVAAMTLPVLMANYQKQQTVVKLKKAYSILGQVAQKAIADNGDVSLVAGEEVSSDNVKDFFTTYWLTYFNAPKIYNRADDWQTSKIDGWEYVGLNGKPYDVSIMTDYSAGRIFFVTQDNMSFFIRIMDWKLEYDDEGNVTSRTAVYSSKQVVCVDINGVKAPNTVGKDMFIFLVDFQNGEVYPSLGKSSAASINENCAKSAIGISCAAKIMRDGWKIKSDYPW